MKPLKMDEVDVLKALFLVHLTFDVIENIIQNDVDMNF